MAERICDDCGKPIVEGDWAHSRVWPSGVKTYHWACGDFSTKAIDVKAQEVQRLREKVNELQRLRKRVKELEEELRGEE